MPLGWIDFSKSERSKVLNVLDMLSEAGTLDELGVAPIRDGFANIFFPGTSTIQTRAKYFLIVPYALKDLEYSIDSNPNRVLRTFDEIERRCGEQLLAKGDDTEGVIGNRSLSNGKWVKRTPADIYWAGLRSYGIFIGGNLSLSEYVRAMCAIKNQKATLARLGNRNDSAEDRDSDDKDAGGTLQVQFWNVPTYEPNWKETLDIKLANEEGKFLRRQIILNYPKSMLSYILENNIVEIFKPTSFLEMESLIHIFPEEVQKDYWLADRASRFIFVLRTVYNIIVSNGENANAIQEWEKMQPFLSEYADLNLEQVFDRLQIHNNVFLCRFLRNSRALMASKDLEGLKTEIRRREREIKQNRAKTLHPGEFDTRAWYGGGYLEYRFTNAKVIIKDIFESEGLHA